LWEPLSVVYPQWGCQFEKGQEEQVLGWLERVTTVDHNYDRLYTDIYNKFKSRSVPFETVLSQQGFRVNKLCMQTVQMRQDVYHGS
jgi:hypothetical protein